MHGSEKGSAIIVFFVHFTGTPWQPEFGGWAFNLPRGQHCLDKWERIPEDTDILVGLVLTVPARYVVIVKSAIIGEKFL
jgi:hypothetical protein